MNFEGHRYSDHSTHKYLVGTTAVKKGGGEMTKGVGIQDERRRLKINTVPGIPGHSGREQDTGDRN